MTTNQFMRWRKRQLEGQGDKYYPLGLYEALQGSVKVTHIGNMTVAEIKATMRAMLDDKKEEVIGSAKILGLTD
jgi:hypothetical protein